MAAYAAMLVLVVLSALPRGLWEDGWFVKRFALNFWTHGVFAWNIADGAVYGMTSQTLQALGALLHRVDPQHLASWLKVALALGAFGAAFVVHRTVARETGTTWGAVPAVVGFSSPLLTELIASGLETALALCAVSLALGAVLARVDGNGRPVALVGWLLLLYLTRPDAVLIPATALLLLGWRARSTWQALLGFALGLASVLLLFKATYGTAFPLAFHLKTKFLGAHADEHLALFAMEKAKNAIQFAFCASPFVLIAIHARPLRAVAALLASALVFAAYHVAFTLETMGHHSRFYLPALAPVLLAAGLGFERFVQTRRLRAVALFAGVWLLCWVGLTAVDRAMRIEIVLPALHYAPFVLACSLMLLAPRLWPAPALVVLLGTAAVDPPKALRWEDDETQLLRQATPRMVFRGLDQLRQRLDVRALFHTDMGAPGVLFPQARVVDLEGLLNEDVALRRVSFETLCRDLRPEAIYIPNPAYQALRAEVLASPCLRSYESVDPDPLIALRVRSDLAARFRGQ